MAEPRRIIHPGPPAPDRLSAVPCRATRQAVTLHAGIPLLAAMTDAVDGAAAWFDLSGIDTDRLSFVRPAPAPGDGHVAWYSATTTLDRARIVCAGAHLGRRDGAAFAHTHGVWADQIGGLHAGHLLAEYTVLARDVTVDVVVLEGARMESAKDPETGFVLFRSVRTGKVEHANAVLATARPHEPIDDIIVKIAGDAGMENATVTGLGSLIGTKFADHAAVGSYATEVLLTKGCLSEGQVDLQAMSVGFDGPHAKGILARSANTICVTFELLLVRDQPVS
ncbi:hypothetical protein [Puniceibacterium sediminis]|uniref:DUF296 domain-containing protein n=1 Tax=Puniceibacterium sediminis TaxID=1608407 RepID=A0A238YEH7_9RHOB|nr:hypothetical protein [Puniceibacterium sediminis]SNR69557.1 hypothetical protein SAMN06265370_11677 [Puniceibacterium sediminis]